jgi:hypothetical protein
MMNLYEKIITIYPSLTNEDFFPSRGTILLQNDGQGDYIALWTNALPQPTQEQLDGVN